MRIQIVESIAGTTIRVTWVSSGVIPGAIFSTLLTGSDSLVSSRTAISSGDGHYYALHDLPDSGGWYINQWVALVGVNTYRSRQLVRAHRLEVD